MYTHIYDTVYTHYTSYFTPFQSPHAERVSNCGENALVVNYPPKVDFCMTVSGLDFGGQKYILCNSTADPGFCIVDNKSTVVDDDGFNT